MPTNDTNQKVDEEIRETYEEYTLAGERVAMIADPENTHAWIQSSYTVEVEP
jgi:hypothetical protein